MSNDLKSAYPAPPALRPDAKSRKTLPQKAQSTFSSNPLYPDAKELQAQKALRQARSGVFAQTSFTTTDEWPKVPKLAAAGAGGGKRPNNQLPFMMGGNTRPRQRKSPLSPEAISKLPLVEAKSILGNLEVRIGGTLSVKSADGKQLNGSHVFNKHGQWMPDVIAVETKGGEIQLHMYRQRAGADYEHFEWSAQDFQSRENFTGKILENLAPSNAESGEESTYDAAELVTYMPSIDGALEQFLASEKYQPAKTILLADANALVSFAREHNLPNIPIIEKFVSNVENDADFYSTKRNIVYAQINKSLRNNLKLLHDPGINIEAKKQAVSLLAIDACPEGTLSSFLNCEIRLTAAKKGLAGKIQQIKIDLLEGTLQSAVQLHHSRDPNLAGNEIHYVNAYMNMLADDFGLEEINDGAISMFSQVLMLPHEVMNVARSAFTPETLLDQFTVEFITQLRQTLHGQGAAEGSQINISSEQFTQVPPNGQSTYQMLDDLLAIENSKYVKLDEEPFLQMSDFVMLHDDGSVTVNLDPDLIKMKFAKLMKQEDLMGVPDVSVSLDLGENGQIKTLGSVDFIESDSGVRSVNIKDIELISEKFKGQPTGNLFRAVDKAFNKASFNDLIDNYRDFSTYKNEILSASIKNIGDFNNIDYLINSIEDNEKVSSIQSDLPEFMIELYGASAKSNNLRAVKFTQKNLNISEKLEKIRSIENNTANTRPTLMHLAASMASGEVVQAMLRDFSPGQIADLVSNVDVYGVTALSTASSVRAPTNDSSNELSAFAAILSAIPDPQKKADLLSTGNEVGMIASAYAVMNGHEDALMNAITSMSDADKRKVMFVSEDRRVATTPLHVAASFAKSDLISDLLDILPQSTFVGAMKTRDMGGKTPIVYSATSHNHSLIDQLLSPLTPQQKFDVLSVQDENGATPIHHALVNINFETLRALFEGLREEDHVELILLRNNHDMNVMEYFMRPGSSRQDVLDALMGNLSADSKVDLLTRPDTENASLISYALQDEVAASAALNGLSSEQKKHVLTKPDPDGLSAIYIAARFHPNTSPITQSLNGFSADEIFDMLTAEDENGHSILSPNFVVDQELPGRDKPAYQQVLMAAAVNAIPEEDRQVLREKFYNVL